MTCLSHYTCRIQYRAQRPPRRPGSHPGCSSGRPLAQAQQPLHVGAGRSSWLFLRAPAVGLRPCVGPAVTLSHPRGASRGPRPGGLSASGWVVTPSYPWGTHTWGSGPAASPCQAGWLPSPSQGAHWGLRPGGLSTSGQAVILAVSQGTRSGAQVRWPLRQGGWSPASFSGLPQGAQAWCPLHVRAGRGHPGLFPQGGPQAQARRGHTACPPLLLALGPAGCHLSTSAPRLPPG